MLYYNEYKFQMIMYKNTIIFVSIVFFGLLAPISAFVSDVPVIRGTPGWPTPSIAPCSPFKLVGSTNPGIPNAPKSSFTPGVFEGSISPGSPPVPGRSSFPVSIFLLGSPSTSGSSSVTSNPGGPVVYMHYVEAFVHFYFIAR